MLPLSKTLNFGRFAGLGKSDFRIGCTKTLLLFISKIFFVNSDQFVRPDEQIWYVPYSLPPDKMFIISFDKKDHITPEEAQWIAEDVAKFYSSRYQICYGVHLNTDDLHIHFALNTVSFIDGKLFSEGWMELERLKRYVNEVILKYRLIKSGDVLN